MFFSYAETQINANFLNRIHLPKNGIHDLMINAVNNLFKGKKKIKRQFAQFERGSINIRTPTGEDRFYPMRSISLPIPPNTTSSHPTSTTYPP